MPGRKRITRSQTNGWAARRGQQSEDEDGPAETVQAPGEQDAHNALNGLGLAALINEDEELSRMQEDGPELSQEGDASSPSSEGEDEEQQARVERRNGRAPAERPRAKPLNRNRVRAMIARSQCKLIETRERPRKVNDSFLNPSEASPKAADGGAKAAEDQLDRMPTLVKRAPRTGAHKVEGLRQKVQELKSEWFQSNEVWQVVRTTGNEQDRRRRESRAQSKAREIGAQLVAAVTELLVAEVQHMGRKLPSGVAYSYKESEDKIQVRRAPCWCPRRSTQWPPDARV
jgi:hypothetical protein